MPAVGSGCGASYWRHDTHDKTICNLDLDEKRARHRLVGCHRRDTDGENSSWHQVSTDWRNAAGISRTSAYERVVLRTAAGRGPITSQMIKPSIVMTILP